MPKPFSDLSRCLLLAAAALPLGAQAQPVLKPFSAQISAVEILSQDAIRCPLPPFLVGKTEGTGAANLMGPVIVQASDCPIPLDASPLPSGFVFGGGRLTLTAANGDHLRAWYRGQLKLVDPSQGAYELNGTYNVVGGSGCFRHALGGGVLKGQINLGPAGALANYQAKGVLLYNPRGCTLPAAIGTADSTD